MNPSAHHDDARFLELLGRWLSGDFTHSDERELKALTDSDEFRREAMEGFMSLPEEDHETRLLALHKNIRLRSGIQAKPPRRVAILRIWVAAAALALFIAAIWVFPKWTADRTGPVAAKQSEPAGKVAPASPALSQPEENQRIAVTPASPPPLAAAPGRSPAAPEKRDKPPAGPAAAEKTEAEGEAATALFETPATSTRAGVPAREDKKEAQTPSKPAQDETLSAPEAAAKDMSNARKMAAPARTTDSIWHKTDLKPDMVAAKKEAREAMQPEFSEPAGGWDAFSEYLRQSARLTLEARNNNASGTVRLQFTVNGNGEPQNFITLRSLGYGCDEEAVRLVKNWDWVRGKSPNVTVEVRFVR